MAERRRGGPRKQLTAEEARQKQLDATYNMASFLPITGEAIAAKEAKEQFEQGNTGMGMLLSLGAIPFAGTAIRPLLRGMGVVAKPIMKGVGTTAAVATKPLMKLRDSELRGNALAGQSNYIDNYYAPSPDVTPTAIEKKVAETYLKRKGEDIKPSLVDRTAQAGRGMLKFSG